MKKTTATLCCFLWAMVSFSSIFAQQGLLDNSFGADGKQVLELPALDEVRDILVQPDGKIIVAGTSQEGETFLSSFVRYLPDGSLDPDFGLNGKNHLLQPQDGPYSVDVLRLQSNGKIVALQEHSNWLMRYRPNGSPDSSFLYQESSLFKYRGLVIGPDDKILAAGSKLGNFEGFLVTRLLPDGAKDLAFGVNGIASFDFGPGYESAVDIAVQPDGKIVVCGTYSSPSPATTDLVIVRLNANGTLDGSFGTNGILVINAGSATKLSPRTLMLQPDGKIAVGISNWDFIALFRFNTDGSPDNTFGTNGEARAEDFSYAYDFALAPDGTFYADCPGSGPGSSILKFTAAGLPDSSFATAGVLHTGQEFYCIAVQADAALVAAATIADDFAVARYLPDGAIDAAFNGGALVRTGIGKSGGTFGALAVQPDGKIVAAGYNFGNWPALARLEADGAQDIDFISKEKFPNDYNGAFYALALQPDGKIVVGGQLTEDVGTEGLFYRLLPDGTPDSSFNGYSGSINSLALQPDGKILTAGVDYDDIGHVASTLARYETDGSGDTGFGTNGWVSTNPCRCDKMVLQTDGKILVGGGLLVLGQSVGKVLRYGSNGIRDSTFGTNGEIQTTLFEFLDILPDGRFLLARNTTDSFAIYRFLPDGMPDTDFGAAGKKVIALINGGIIHAMQVQPDGKILLAGEATGDQGEIFYLLARLLPDGSPDVTAGVGGFVTTGFNEDFPYDQAYALAVQPDGKIVLAGTSLIITDTSGYFAFSLVRYQTDLTVESKEIIDSGSARVLQMSPNPASDALHIQINDSEKWNISIHDIQGRQMYQRETTGAQTVWVKDWSSGVYVVRAVAGGRVFSGKFVKP